MATLTNPLNINGVISTDKTVLQNLNDICSAAGAFLTYDISQGKWAVVINKTGSSVKSYNDANIIGSINVTETGVSELYNNVRLEFPHRLLGDESDFVELEIPSGNRFQNEIPKSLNIQSDLINDPVQAQYIASVELKQSRLNKIITFTTDYTSLGMKAGDLIDVTASMYGYTSKVFRIISLEENDSDVITISITAMEYSADVYSTAGLVAVEKTKKTGILLKQQNTAIQESEDANTAATLGRMIAANVGLGVVNSLLNKLFGRQQIGVDANGNPIFSKQTKPANDAAAELDKVLSGAKKPALQTITSSDAVCAGTSVTVTVGHTCSSCLFDIPPLDYAYAITGVLEEDLDIALTGKVTVTNGVGLLTIFVAADAPSGTMSVTIGGLNKTIEIGATTNYTYTVTRNNPSITEGGTVIVTLTATGTKANASIPYAITGTATGKVSSPALTGTVTTSGGTATLTIVTANDSIYQGTQGLTVTFEPAMVDICGTIGTNNTSITVLDNESAPPADVTRQYALTPVVWEGVYDGTTGRMKSVFVSRSAYMPLPLSGEATVNVPVTLSVASGSPSTITITSTRAISTTVLGGTLLEPIISFNTVAPNSAITGTKTQVWGYY